MREDTNVSRTEDKPIMMYISRFHRLLQGSLYIDLIDFHLPSAAGVPHEICCWFCWPCNLMSSYLMQDKMQCQPKHVLYPGKEWKGIQKHYYLHIIAFHVYGWVYLVPNVILDIIALTHTDEEETHIYVCMVMYSLLLVSLGEYMF